MHNGVFWMLTPLEKQEQVNYSQALMAMCQENKELFLADLSQRMKHGFIPMTLTLKYNRSNGNISYHIQRKLVSNIQQAG